jgi:colanic acid biosynthesis glycosyl transferase WcaI
MKILVYGINFAPELTGIGKYTGEMVEYLATQKHDVAVVTAPPYYPQWKIQAPYKKWWYQKEFMLGAKVIRCPMYVPQTPKTLTRLLHLADFALSSFVGLFSQFSRKWDVIVVIEPTLFCTPAALLFAKLTGAKAWLHIQDYEIDAMFSLGMAHNAGFVKKSIYRIESALLKKFDRVSSISQSMIAIAEKKGVVKDRLVFFPNWVDITHIQPLPNDTTYRQKWNIPQSDFVVLYSGNIGKKQGLDIVLQAAEYFKAKKNIHFLIVGDGAHKAVLESHAKTLSNVQFHPLQPYQHLSQLMALANVHLVVQQAGAADLVLPSKLTTILAAGGYSIITANKGTELGDFCEREATIAQRVDAEDKGAFIAAIEQQFGEYLQRDKVNHAARQFAEEHLVKEVVLNTFTDNLISVIQG